ncbi:MAG TPA: IS4 family transposase [Anaeromyxobacteraceae bacterium]|nr:IS4 family transposase [Anaeromyxobacteraceae bacterium]
MAGLDLGDRRRDRRALEIADRLAAAPEASLPVAMHDDAMREALYRHLGSEGVNFDALLQSHVTRTGARVRAADGLVYALHDTTACTFDGEAERAGVGVVNGEKQGFFAHTTLAVSADDQRTPLGILGCELWTREGARDLEECESARWSRGVNRACDLAGDRSKLVHVADREGDIYELLAAMVANSQRFIVRAKQDRVVEIEGEGRTRLFDAARETRLSYSLEVPVSERGGKRSGALRRVHPDRAARIASLTFAALSVTLRRPRKPPRPDLPAELPINVVHVFEVGSPTGEQRIEWLLLTTEPIATREQIAAVIEGYRTRWTIEEYFKALKTGCAFEKRQLESFRTLSNLLAYSLVVAYAILLLRSISRSNIPVPADALASKDELLCLSLMTTGKPTTFKTAREVLAAIAKLGAHIKNNGDPGWRVLSRGWKRLLDFEAAYQAMKGAGLVINR